MGVASSGGVAGTVQGDRIHARTRRWPRLLVWVIATLVGVVLSVVTLGMLIEEGVPDRRIALLLLVEILCGGASLALLGVVLARRSPSVTLPMALAVAFLGALGALGTPAALVAVALVSARRRVGPGAAVIAAFLVGGAGSILLDPGAHVGESAAADATTIALAGGVVAVAALIGLDLGAREQRVRSLAERVELVEQVQAVRIAQGRAQERARIAREMHDSLAHSLSLVSLHAAVLESRNDLTDAEIRDSAGAIRGAAAAANAELRDILRVLHEEHVGDSSRATWTDVLGLVEGEERAGQRIHLHLPEAWERSEDGAAGAFAALPVPLRHIVVRVLQESLTNARRHAPGLPVDVRLDEDATAIALDVTNDFPSVAPPGAPSGGRGLPGLAERVSLAGGSFTAGASQQRFRVSARVPWTR